MSLGDFRDGSAISFKPQPRTTKAWSRALALALVVAALAFSWQSMQEDRAAYPALAGGLSASGMLDGPVEESDGTHVGVTFMPPGAVYTATSIEPTGSLDEKDAGRTYKVYYLADDVTVTFIEGLDHVEVDWESQAMAGGGLLVALILLVRPFKVKARQRRVKRVSRHAA